MVNVTFAFSDPSETGIDAPSTGVLKFALVNIEEASGVLRTTEQFKVELVDGSAVVPLSATSATQAWHVRATGVSGVAQWWKAVPSGSSDVNFLDLVDVDPSTLLPSDASVPAWDAAVDEVNAGLADTIAARNATLIARDATFDARDEAGVSAGLANSRATDSESARDDSVIARNQSEQFAANTVALQDSTFTALIADEDSATRTQLNATMGAYLDVNVPGEVSGALASDPVVQAGVEAAIDTGLPPAIAAVLPGAVTTEVTTQVTPHVTAAIDTGLPPAIAAVLPGAVTTEVTTQVTPHVTAAAGSATAAQTARAGAESARDLALAGQFAGSDLGTANLNTITTPGVYRQGTTENATPVLNYPVASVQGVLEVFHSTATSSIFQRYMQTTGTASGKGHWQRRYTSSAWSAWGFVATQRVDQSAGRVIYAWDDVNNREQLIYGDTGWRDITASMGSVVTGGSVFVRRYGATVFIALSGVTVPIVGTVNGALPIGFRIAHAVALPTPYGSITTWDTNGNLAFSALGTGRYAGVSFPTSNVWPTTLPGTPVGSIPS